MADVLVAAVYCGYFLVCLAALHVTGWLGGKAIDARRFGGFLLGCVALLALWATWGAATWLALTLLS